MKKIIYKTPGAALAPGVHGSTRLNSIGVTVELPYCKVNLERAEAEALPGSLQICEESEETAADEARDRLVLKDRATGKPYELYVENGKLMMEVL